jgi:hypothetical protein
MRGMQDCRKVLKTNWNLALVYCTRGVYYQTKQLKLSIQPASGRWSRFREEFTKIKFEINHRERLLGTPHSHQITPHAVYSTG